MSDIWTCLSQFVAADIGKPMLGALDLSRDTDLYHDLDMNPDHIARFMSAWAVRFDIDITAFDIDDFYPSAKLGIGAFLASVLKSPFSANARETLGGHALTLGMLEEAMKSGRWVA